MHIKTHDALYNLSYYYIKARSDKDNGLACFFMQEARQIMMNQPKGR